jgi:hypothetical protein
MCGDCAHYHPTSKDTSQGECRRRCPVPILLGVQQKPHAILPKQVVAQPMVHAFWPTVGGGNFCGEWELRQPKKELELTVNQVNSDGAAATSN